MLRNVKLGTKIVFLILCMIVLLTGTAYVGYDALWNIQYRAGRIVDVNQLIEGILKARIDEKNYVYAKDSEYIKEVDSYLESVINQAKAAKSRFQMEINKEQMDAVINKTAEFQSAFKAYVDLEKRKNANTSEQERASIDREQRIAEENMVKAATEATKECDDAVTSQDNQMTERITVSNGMFLISFLMALLIGLIFFIITIRMVQDLRNQKSQIAEASRIVASSSSEIASTSAQFATSMSETATSISETSSTTEELKQAAKLSNEKSQRVSQSAQGAVQISQEGLKSTGDTIEGMKNMIAQMKAIAESIARLSDQNQAIGDIMVVIEDLAEQTNLLAVNAAIEAVRAGEQGKGFGVVAEEIRSLADQSKQATAQVKTILQNVQKAVGTTVMTAEKGMNAADAGMKQSKETGDAIKKMVESIEKTSQTMLQIAASSQQQLVGVEQISEAIANIKQASDQNSESAVQLEEAAKNLNQLGDRLQLLSSQLNV